MTTTRPIIHTRARPAYLTPAAFAEHFTLSKMTVYRLMHEGSVKWVRIGRQMRIPVAELQRFTRAAEAASSAEVWGES